MSCDLNHGEDQRQILDAAAAMLAAGFPVSRLRDAAADDLAPIAEFGTYALALPEAGGGAGFGIVEEALVHELFGRHLVSTRVLATAIAARVAAASGRDDLAAALRGGALSACAAIPARDGLLLADPASATLALVFGERRLSLLDIDGAATQAVTGLGHSVTLRRLDPGRPTVLTESADGEPLAVADLLVSAQLLGVAVAARDLAVGYAGVRRQFGKPIGAFQAIKHHCANMAIAAEMLSAQLDMAAIALGDGRADASFQIAALRRLAPRTALANARACIQIHGGIGFSAEADAHHFLKQAHLLARLGGAAPILDLPAPLAPLAPLRPLYERT